MPRTPVGRAGRRNIDPSLRPVPELVDVIYSGIDENTVGLLFRRFTGTTAIGNGVPVLIKPGFIAEIGSTTPIVSFEQNGPDNVTLTLSGPAAGVTLTFPPFMQTIRTYAGGYLAPVRAMLLAE